MTENVRELRCEGKVVIVTGGVQGIGRACVDILDDDGSKMSTGGTGEIIYMQCDVRKEEEIKVNIEETVSRLGSIDILVNNVGCHPGSKSIDESSVQDFRELLNINLVSCFAVSKFAMPHLRKSKGCIVNISSNVVTHACRNSTSYTASKGGITALTKAMAVDEAKHGIRVNSIAPGAVGTALLDALLPKDDKEKLQSCFQLGRLATPQEIGRACLYLAVDATFTTGSELTCTGGSEIGYGVKDHDGIV